MTYATGHWPFLICHLKPPVRLDINQAGIWPFGEQVPDDIFPTGVSCIERQRRSRIQLVVRAQIKNSRERFSAAGRTPGISKALLLKSASSHVPEIFSARQIQPVSFAPNGQSAPEIESDLSKGIFVVHQVVKRKTRKGPRRRQFLKEGSMRSIGWIVSAAPSKISASSPRLEPDSVEQVSGFSGGGVRAVTLRSPRSGLNRSPEQHIRFAFAGIKDAHVVAANRRDVDFPVIGKTSGNRPVIGFQHVTPIAIIRSEEASLAVTRRPDILSPRAVDNIDIQFIHAFDLEDAFCWPGCQNRQVRVRRAA